MVGQGIINNNWGAGCQKETYDVEEAASASFKEVEGRGATSSVLEAMVQVDEGVLQPKLSIEALEWG